MPSEMQRADIIWAGYAFHVLRPASPAALARSMSHVTSISPACGCSSQSVQRCGVRSFQRILPPDAWKRASMASDLRDGLPSMMWY